MSALGGVAAQISSLHLQADVDITTESSGKSIMSIWPISNVQTPEKLLHFGSWLIFNHCQTQCCFLCAIFFTPSLLFTKHGMCTIEKFLVYFYHFCPLFNGAWAKVEDSGRLWYFFCHTGCQGCDWISVIWSDYRALAGFLCPLHVWINSRISLTDLLCVPCRQIGQLVPRWQLYRYGGNWCGAQGHPADSSWCLLEVPSLHWSSHVPEV